MQIMLLILLIFSCAPSAVDFDYEFTNKDISVRYNFVKQGENLFIEGLIRDTKQKLATPSVNVEVNSTVGTVSNLDGKFRIKLPEEKGKIRIFFTGLTDDKFSYDVSKSTVRDSFLEDFTK